MQHVPLLCTTLSPFIWHRQHHQQKATTTTTTTRALQKSPLTWRETDWRQQAAEISPSSSLSSSSSASFSVSTGTSSPFLLPDWAFSIAIIWITITISRILSASASSSSCPCTLLHATTRASSGAFFSTVSKWSGGCWTSGPTMTEVDRRMASFATPFACTSSLPFSWCRTFSTWRWPHRPPLLNSLHLRLQFQFHLHLHLHLHFYLYLPFQPRL